MTADCKTRSARWSGLLVWVPYMVAREYIVCLDHDHQLSYYDTPPCGDVRLFANGCNSVVTSLIGLFFFVISSDNAEDCFDFVVSFGVLFLRRHQGSGTVDVGQ